MEVWRQKDYPDLIEILKLFVGYILL